jgi:hypothetical protein
MAVDEKPRPRLHKYRERNACHVLTAIRAAVMTYQLTPDGERKLTGAGIAPGPGLVAGLDHSRRRPAQISQTASAASRMSHQK